MTTVKPRKRPGQEGTEPSPESVELAQALADMQDMGQHETAEGCCKLADAAFKASRFDVAFALVRAGVHRHGMNSDKLCKRYLFNLEMIVKGKAQTSKKTEGPPRMLYLRELYASIHQVFKDQVAALAGPDAMNAGDKCVLMKERGVMVVGLSLQEWRVLLEKNTGSDKMQMISGVEEAVMRGLSQSEGTSDSQTELKASWNSWALKLCEVEGGSPHLRSKCLLQRTVLLLQQQQHQKALESAAEVLKLYPDSKHASALLATSQHKAGKKKESASTVSELVLSFQRAEDSNMLSDELGHPLELTVALLVEMHRTKDALKLLACLLSRVHGARQQHLFFGLARLYAKHGLNKDALVAKLPSLCSMPPDRRTWELLKSMAECTPTAVEAQLQRYIDEAGPGHFTHVPQITEVMCKLPFGAHGSAAGKALQLLKQCATQVTPERPEDLRIIVDDLRAFMSSNIPASVSELFPRTIETLLNDYVKALGPQHSMEAWEMPAELMKRAFNGSPPPALHEQIQCACLRVPVERENFLWTVFRNLPPETGTQLVRAWLLQHDPDEISRVERAMTHVHTTKGEHAAALDIMRWVESKELRVLRADAERWTALYYRVLRNTAEERASMKRGGSLASGGLDMSTSMLHADEFPFQLAYYHSYHAQLTGVAVPLRNITQKEALILRRFRGDDHHDAPQGDEHDPMRQQEPLFASRSDGEVYSWAGSNAAHHVTSHLISPDSYGQARHDVQFRAADADAASSVVDPSLDGNLGSNAMLDGSDLSHANLYTNECGDGDMKHAGVLIMEEEGYGRQSVLAENGSHLAMSSSHDAMRGSMFNRTQLELALRTMKELHITQIPVTLEDESWQRVLSDLFLAEGWRHLAIRYGHRDRKLAEQLLVADLQALQEQMLAATMQGNDLDPASPVEHSLQWLAELLAERLQTLDSHALHNTAPKELAAHLAFEIGQSNLWVHAFALQLQDRASAGDSYFTASPDAQASFKLAFMHAADTLSASQRSTAGGGAPDAAVDFPGGVERSPVSTISCNRQTGACHALLKSDPRAALAMAQQILELVEGNGNGHDERVALLHLVCSDACFGLEQYGRAVSHFQRYSGGVTAHMPLDAFLEYICAMLFEGFPSAQVLQATEEGCPFDGRAHDWQLFVKVLAEMMDVDDAMEQAQDEENRHMVNKLLMLLGNNVTNKRERDARMQRCLQEGGDASGERDASGARRVGSSRRARAEEGADIDIQKLQDFWAGLPACERPALCSVALEDFDKAIHQLCAAVAGAEREAPRESGTRANAPISSDPDVSSRPDALLLQLHSCLVESDLPSGNGGGFGFSDALCDIKSLSSRVGGPNTFMDAPDILGADTTAPARGLFCIIGQRVTLNQTLPLEGVLLQGGAAAEGHDTSGVGTGCRDAGTLVLTEPVGDESTGGDSVTLLKRLLAIEASFELDLAGKGQPRMELGTQISFQQLVTVVRMASTLHLAGEQLPHAKRALGELCRRLLRKEPMRAIMTAQRALLAQLARLMLRGVRAAFGEEQQKLKKEEAERAEQELLEALDAEDSKLKDEGKKRVSKKKKGKRSGLVDGGSSELGHDARIGDANTIPGAYAGWDDAAALASEAYVAAERGQAAAVLSVPDALATPSALATTASASLDDDYWNENVEDSAGRDAREAAAVLRVVEAAERAEAAAAAMAADNTELKQSWEEVPQRRRNRNRPSETADGEGLDATPPLRGRARGDAENDAFAEARKSTEAEPMSADGLDTEARNATPAKQDGSDEDSAVEATSAQTSDGSGSGTAEATRDGTTRLAHLVGSKQASGSDGQGMGPAALNKRTRRPKGAPQEREDSMQAEMVTASGGNCRRKGKSVASGATAPGSADDESTAVGVAAAPGLENKTGQHSCFVNVVVQTLWNVSAFRDAFVVCEPHKDARGEDRSIFLAMKQVCSMMEDGAAAAAADAPQGKPQQVTASALKEALFRLDSSFELGEMHDATEAHEALLEALHRALAPPQLRAPEAGHVASASGAFVGGSSLANSTGSGITSGVPLGDGAASALTPLESSSGDGSPAGSLIKHIFSMCMRMEYARPSDPEEEHSKPVTFDQWTQYIVASELRKQVREAVGGDISPLVRVLRMAAGSEPSSGEGKGQPAPGCSKLQMLRTPRVFTLGLASDTAHASKAEISESLQGIDERLRLRHVYQGLVEDGSCHLVALTAFYEQHYVCFCFSQVAGQWIHYDDDTRRLVGKDFGSVKEKCIAGRLHPQLLFYEARP